MTARLLVVVLAACGARTDLVPEESPADVGSVEVGMDAGMDASTLDAGTGCRGLPRAPRVLVEDGAFEPAAIALRGSTLFFGANDVRGPREAPTGGIYRVPTLGGAYERLELSEPYYANTSGLLVGADYLVYHQVRTAPLGSGWTFDYPAIVVERERGDARVLPTNRISGTAAMALLGDRVIFGREESEEVGSIELYEARSDMESTIGRADVTAAVGAGRHVYLWAFDAGESLLLRVTSAADIIEVERFDDSTCCWPWAADAGALYLWRGGAIEAWPVGEAPIVLAETTASRFASVAVDDDWLYWSDEGRVHYVDKAGGPVRTLVDGGSSDVQGLTTDGCGVYYSVVNPPRVMVVSAP